MVPPFAKSASPVLLPQNSLPFLRRIVIGDDHLLQAPDNVVFPDRMADLPGVIQQIQIIVDPSLHSGRIFSYSIHLLVRNYMPSIILGLTGKLFNKGGVVPNRRALPPCNRAQTADRARTDGGPDPAGPIWRPCRAVWPERCRYRSGLRP